MKKGWTVEYLAALGGVTAQTQRRYEAGKRTPGVDYLVTLASGCGLDIQYVVTGIRSPNAPGQREIIDAQLREERGEHDGEVSESSALSSIVHGMERASIYMVPELLEAVMEATEGIPKDQRPDILMRAYSLIYAAAPSEESLNQITTQDLEPVVALIRKLQQSASDSTPEKPPPEQGGSARRDQRGSRLSQARRIRDEGVPTPPLRKKGKKTG